MAGAGLGVGEVTASGDGVSFWSDENVMELEAMVAQLCKYVKNK